MNKYHYQYRQPNAASWHDLKVEADSQAEAQTIAVETLGTDFELRLADDDTYGEEELLQIDALT